MFRAERKKEMKETKSVWEVEMTYKYIPLSQSLALSIYLPSSLLYPKRWSGAMGCNRGQRCFLCLLEQQMDLSTLQVYFPSHRYLPLSPSVLSCHELMLWIVWISDCTLPGSVGSWLLPGDRLLGYTFTREIYVTATQWNSYYAVQTATCFVLYLSRTWC